MKQYSLFVRPFFFYQYPVPIFTITVSRSQASIVIFKNYAQNGLFCLNSAKVIRYSAVAPVCSNRKVGGIRGSTLYETSSAAVSLESLRQTCLTFRVPTRNGTCFAAERPVFWAKNRKTDLKPSKKRPSRQLIA